MFYAIPVPGVSPVAFSGYANIVTREAIAVSTGLFRIKNGNGSLLGQFSGQLVEANGTVIAF